MNDPRLEDLQPGNLESADPESALYEQHEREHERELRESLDLSDPETSLYEQHKREHEKELGNASEA
jgi:hypothetical protein